MSYRSLSRLCIYKSWYRRFSNVQKEWKTNYCIATTSSFLHFSGKERVLNPCNYGFIKKLPIRFQHPANKSEQVPITTSADKKFVILSETDKETANFQALWLRHNCHCPSCREPHSGQKMIAVLDLKPSYTIATVSVDPKENVHIQWNEENHPSVFPLSFLKENKYSKSALQNLSTNSALRMEDAVDVLPKLEYEALLEKEGLLQWMKILNQYGLCLIQNVPLSEGMVQRVAEKIWPIQNTIYGSVWDVKSELKPINIAYSNVELDFHMDLVYYESPPGIQFLHCMRFDNCIEGGESLFVDAWHVAETLRLQHPEDFEILSRIPATFQKIHSQRDHPVHMKYQRPHIAVTPAGQVIGIFWAPAFEGPLQIEDSLVESYYRAYRRFASLIHSSPTKITFRLVPGDLISFNNRRILHARGEFKLNEGIRHLQGCYVNIDEFKSSFEVLSRSTGKESFSKHVLNQTWA